MVVGEDVVANLHSSTGDVPQSSLPPPLQPPESTTPACVHLEVGNDEGVPGSGGVNGNIDGPPWRAGRDGGLPVEVGLEHDGDMSECSTEGPWEEDDLMSLVSSVSHSSLVSSSDNSPQPQHNTTATHTNSTHTHTTNTTGRTPIITHLTNGGQTCVDSDVTSLDDDDDVTPDYTSTSLTSTPVPPQLCIVSATVTGFTTEKTKGSSTATATAAGQESTSPEQPAYLPAGGNNKALGHPDIVFIVELTWSDGRVNVITRTYIDFCRLQYYLINEFVDVPANESPARLNIYLPVRRDVLPEDSFAQAHAEPQDSILLAESRELLLNQYVQELIKLPSKISASPTALTFFESRNSDPVPYRETIDTSRVNVTDQYVLCWI